MSKTIVSMTGFGRASATLGPRTVRVEIRSLNHRGLDVKIRTHDLRLAAELETEMLRMVRGRLVRGSVAINITDEGTASMAAGIDLARIRQVHASLEQLRREIGQATPVDLATVGAFLAGSHNGTAVELPATSWPELAAAMALALDGLVGMRVQEGRAISDDLQGRLSTLRSLIDAIAGMAAANPGRANRRLEERLSALSGTMPGLEPTRLAQEAAVLAERLDVSEELARLRAHFDHLAGLLAGDAKDAPGRRMDFLAQEIGRELNTLGGKVQDAAIAALVIDGKSELEKLREQVQNIE